MRAQSASPDKESARTARTSYSFHQGNPAEPIIDPDERPRPIDSGVTEHAQAIRSLGKRVLADVIEIGRRLTECKGLVGHGNWGTWLDREFGWTDQTARNYMRVHEIAKSKNILELGLPVSSLYLLAKPSTPQDVQDEMIEQAERGEKPTLAEIRERVRESRLCASIAPATANAEAPIEDKPSHPRHRGSGQSTSSAVSIATRLLVELIAHGTKAEPKSVVHALRKKLPQGDPTDELIRWLDCLLTEMRAGTSGEILAATTTEREEVTP
jgi:hypothetical protein